MDNFNLPIMLYNSMSRQKELFQPQNPSRITFYQCGPTIYAEPHIGNARPAVVFDILYRILRHTYGEEAVVFARNFTDIDDKIIAAAKERNMNIKDITQSVEKEYLKNMDELKVLRPTYMPRATEYLNKMNEMITKLVNSGHAYVSNKNEVLFHVPHSNHISLAKHEVDALDSGARVEIDPSKKDPRDFVLWKPSNNGEPEFDSPYGPGRPGWHIECSAMIAELLGETIDIHGGGQDLRFPHHEAEITQSHSCWNKPLANYWLHNGMLTVDGKKMAKSQNNFITVNEALQKFPGETIRFFLLKTHYRQPLNWTWESLENAHNELNRLYRKLQDNRRIQVDSAVSVQVLIALFDDMNTPKAITELFKEAEETEMSVLKESAKLLGLLQDDPDDWFKKGIDIDEEIVQKIIDERNEARKNKDWKKSDALRDELHLMGIEVEDTGNSSIWRRI